jgi:ubiquinone/menaquinone biosynthesis C-methylase UbiE
VLDVGCGTGEDARAIAALLPGIAVLGIDRSEEAIREARARTLGLPRSIDFRVADACALPLEADAFDATRADRVFHHLEDPRTALAELVRVTRPGGRVVVSDVDYDTLVVEGADPRTSRRILAHHAERVESGRVGRQLRGLFLEAGLDGLAVLPYAAVVTEYDEEVLRLGDKAERAVEAGVVGAAEAERWRAALAAADRAGRFLCAVVVFTVSGHRP